MPRRGMGRICDRCKDQDWRGNLVLPTGRETAGPREAGRTEPAPPEKAGIARWDGRKCTSSQMPLDRTMLLRARKRLGL
jgi:hypothetical protein